MSSYKMPIVCKEVYLPIIDEIWDETLTAEQYEELTGIDINKLFYFVGTDLYTAKFTKIYLVVATSEYIGSNNIVLCNFIYANDAYTAKVSDEAYGGYLEITKDDSGVKIRFSTI